MNYHQTDKEMNEELELIQRSKKDPRAFSELYDRYFDQIFRFVYRRVDNENVTADLTQNTFLKALSNINSYKFQGVPFSAWLYRIASNEVVSYYRKYKQEVMFSVEEDMIRQVVDENEEAIGREDIGWLIEKLDVLPPDQLEILELRFLEGKSFEDIAYIMGIKEGTAKMRLYRALEKIRKELNIIRK